MERRGVAGLIGRALAEVQRLTADLGHIKSTIQVFDPTTSKRWAFASANYGVNAI